MADRLENRTADRRDRLLIVQPLVGIGDMVWHKPWIDHLASQFDVILAAKPTARAETVFHGTAGIVDWLPIEQSMRGRRGRHDGLSGLLRLAAAFRAARADQVLIIHHSASYAVAARLAGIPHRWGYGIGSSRRWLNRGAFLEKSARYEHPTRKLPAFAAINGFGIDQPCWHIQPSQTATARVDDIFDTHNIAPLDHGLRDTIIMGVGAMDEERRWPPSHFAKLAAMLSAAHPATRIILMGAPAEQPIIDAVLADASAPSGLISAVRPLDQAVAMLAAARLYVGNDTSLLNIAAACGRPAAGLFAQTRPLDYTPLIVAVPVPDGRFGMAGGIATIQPDHAFAVVDDLLHSQSSGQ